MPEDRGMSDGHEGFAPGTFGFHEALHMASFFAAAVDKQLCDHPAIMRDPELRAQAIAAVEAIGDLYQMLGKKWHDAETAKEAGQVCQTEAQVRERALRDVEGLTRYGLSIYGVDPEAHGKLVLRDDVIDVIFAIGAPQATGDGE